MLQVGDTIPDATVQSAPGQDVRLRELAADGAILRRGNAADRQLRTFNANRDVVEVVRDIADVTEAAATR